MYFWVNTLLTFFLFFSHFRGAERQIEIGFQIEEIRWHMVDEFPWCKLNLFFFFSVIIWTNLYLITNCWLIVLIFTMNTNSGIYISTNSSCAKSSLRIGNATQLSLNGRVKHKVESAHQGWSMKDKSKCLRTYNLTLMRNGLIIHNLGR